MTWFKALLTALPLFFTLVLYTPLVAKGMDCYIHDMLCFPISDKRTDYVKDELLLLFPKNYSKERQENLLKHYDLVEVGSDALDSLDVMLSKANTSGQDPLELSKIINRTYDDIEAATNNFYVSSLTAEVSKKRYPHSLTGAGLALDYSKGEGVLIGLIDGPVDIRHESFRGRIKQINLLSNKSDSVAYLSHGTAMAGVLISADPRIGIAPAAKLLSITAFNYTENEKSTSNSRLVAKAIDIAIQKKVDILNLSFSGGRDLLVDKLIQRARKRGILVVASCGNDASNKPAYPAATDGVLAVTAVDHLKNAYVHANKGSYIDVAAPGVGVLTTAPGNRYRLSTGTSIAAANVSASLALLLARKPKISQSLLSYTAVDLGKPGRDPSYGEGLINVMGAMQQLIR